MVLVVEKRIPCGGCREEDSPITIWKEGFKRKGEGRDCAVVQFEERTERTDHCLCLHRQFGGYVRVTLVIVRFSKDKGV